MAKQSIWASLFILLALVLSASSVPEFTPTPTYQSIRSDAETQPPVTSDNSPTSARSPDAAAMYTPTLAPTPDRTPMRVSLAVTDIPTPGLSSTTGQLPSTTGQLPSAGGAAQHIAGGLLERAVER